MDRSYRPQGKGKRIISSQEEAKNKILNQDENIPKADKILTVSEIIASFQAMKKKYGDISVIHQSLGAESFYIPVLKAALTPFVLERLSIFSENFPQLYSQHIFCGWLAALIARDMKMDGHMATHLVMAAMCRDIGLLYLPQKLLSNDSAFNSTDWKAMKSHPIIGEIIARNIGQLSSVTTDAILEHHERVDGMGYPKGLTGENVSIAGKIVAVVDSVSSIRLKQLYGTGRNLRDVFSNIHMNEDGFSPEVIKSLFRILVKTGLKKSVVNPFKTTEQLISHLYVRGSAMHGGMQMLERLMDYIIFFDPGKKRNALLKYTPSVLKRIHKTGMLDDKMIKWLNNLDTTNNKGTISIEELSEIELLQNEVYWQLKQVTDLLQSFHDFEMKKSNRSAQSVTAILHCLSEKNLPRAAPIKRKRKPRTSVENTQKTALKNTS